MSATKLETAIEAIDFLTQFREKEIDQEIEFTGELVKFDLVIEGPGFCATVPGELARGIWELQESLYKAAAFALTGSEDIRRLSAVQRQNLELIFEVKEGSTELLASLDKFFTALGDGFKSMSESNRKKTLICIAIIIAGTFLSYRGIDGYLENQEKDAQRDHEIKLMQIVRDAALAGQAIDKFDKAVEDGAKSVIRGAPTATGIKFNSATFDQDQIQAVNQRAARVRSIAESVEDEFRIYSGDSHSSDSTRFTLGGSDGQEFAVSVNDSDLSKEDLEKIWNAFKARARIKLEVTITRNRGVIRSAQITNVL